MKHIFSFSLSLFVLFCSAQNKNTVNPETVTIYQLSSGKDFISLSFFTTNKTPFSQLEIWRSDGKEANKIGVATQRYNVKDTVVYIYTDTKIKANAVYQYSAIPVLADGNKGMGSTTIFVSTKLFGNFYFKQSVAEKNTANLGIDVRYALSSIDHIKSIEIYKGNSVEGPFELLAITPSTQTIYTDLNVQPDKVYFYKLKAQNFITNEQIETAAFFDVGMPTTKPVVPTLQSVVQTANGVVIKIEVSEPYLAGVNIYRKADRAENFELIQSAVKCDSSVIVIDSTQNTGNFTYAAKAENASRIESDFSNQISIAILSNEQPEYTGKFDAMYDNTTVKLFWDMAGFRRFKLSRKEENGKATWLNDNTELLGNRFVDTTILPEKNYEYVLYAINENSLTSNGAIAVVQTPKDELVSNQTLRGASVAEGVVLEWGAVADVRVAKQNLYRTQVGTAPSLLSTMEMNQFGFVDKTAKLDEIYRYYLVSIDAKGNAGEKGNEISVRHKN